MIKSEEKIAKILRKRGFKIFHIGWPDFLCINKKTNRCFALEVKKGTDRIKPHQQKMHDALNDCGLPVYVTYGRENLRRKGRKIFTEEVRKEMQDRIDKIIAENNALRKAVIRLEKKLGEKHTRTPNGVLVQDFKDDYQGFLEIERDDNNVIDITKNIKFGPKGAHRQNVDTSS